MSHSPAAFPPTRWSLVAAARNAEVRRAALEELCRLYWPPLYAFARRSGIPRPDAEDATQAFFAAILNDATLEAAAAVHGRLRSYLLASFSHDLIDARRREKAERRGGRVQMVALDGGSLEAHLEIPSPASPEAQFDRDWAICVLREAVNAVAEAWTAAGRGADFERLRVFLSPEGDPPTYESLSAETGQSVEALRQNVSRLRAQFRTALRQTVADTLVQASPERVDSELEALRSALAL